MRSIAVVPASLVVAALVVIGAVVLMHAATPADHDPARLLATAAASAEPSGAVGADLIPLDPVTPPVEADGECAYWHATIDRVPMTMEQLAGASSAVVRAVVEDIGGAQWNTSDRNPPRDMEPAWWHVMRLVRLKPIEALIGEPGTTTVWVPGGTIGCLTFVVQGFEIDVGREYLFFLFDKEPSSAIEGTLQARQYWPIEGDAVSSPLEGKLPFEVVEERLAGS